jgi:hypothetical protein
MGSWGWRYGLRYHLSIVIIKTWQLQLLAAVRALTPLAVWFRVLFYWRLCCVSVWVCAVYWLSCRRAVDDQRGPP